MLHWVGSYLSDIIILSYNFLSFSFVLLTTLAFLSIMNILACCMVMVAIWTCFRLLSMCATLGSLVSTSSSFFAGCLLVSLACSSFDLLTCFFISTSYIAFDPILPFSSMLLHQRFYAIATFLSSFSPIPNFCSIDKHFHSDRIFDLGIFFYRIDRIGIEDWLRQFLNY